MFGCRATFSTVDVHFFVSRDRGKGLRAPHRIARPPLETPVEPTSPLTLDEQSARSRPATPQPAESGLRRSMGPRHLVMIAMGGVIGSGLFLSSGYTISQAGPLGAVIAYLVGAFVVYLVMACLGELAIAYPVSGAFHIYAARSI